jgi:hypothetical protein
MTIQKGRKHREIIPHPHTADPAPAHILFL